MRQIANRCINDGRINDGIEAHKNILLINDNLSDIWYNLGYLERCGRRYTDAIHSYRRALEIGIARREEVHLNISAIFSEHLNQADQAEKELITAIRVNPYFILAWLNLGNLYEDMGDPEKARSAYRSALDLEPENGRALGRLAMIDIFEAKASESVIKLRATLEDNSILPDDAAEISFALGHALDAVGEYDDAFAAFTIANTAMQPVERYSALRNEQLIDSLINIFAHPSTSLYSDDTKPLIFICGMFRSGSTLAEQRLALHSRVTAGGEFEFIPALVAEKLQPYPQKFMHLNDAQLLELRNAYLNDLKAIYPKYDIITDKRPDNFLHIGLIKALFPNAKIVHTYRQPLDNILSIYFGHFDKSIIYGNELENIAHWYLQYSRLMQHWKQVYPNDIFDLNYDRLVVDSHSSMSELLSFCGLETEKGVATKAPKSSIVKTLSSWQVRQPLHARSSGRWKNYEAHLTDIIKIFE